ncbi:MAG: hypothetical protein KC544_05130 [Gemmatimonadetes bacterium]|nr:hypothetical protein [Gemmatimonadota bacterium]MCB9504790.1 hypothetical protein [Gemmatimonadales bacterium]MCA9762497.1 hypothetical protein [Gemmatimonadota bacterium]MCA9768928.1 hypothetical protein [Gemmatimonadota bacterium]MCB9518816.1 hypothetical protein [Gemmatimonadales bacterium]
MARVAALVLAALGLLPIANWIAGGHAAPWYADRLDLWTSGAAILLGLAAIAVIVLRSRPGLWPAGAWDRAAARWQDAGTGGDLLVAGVAGALYLVVALAVLSGRPLLIDEIIQVVQARIFAGGRLFLPAPAHPEFTAAMHLLDMGGKVYGQFPAGGPAMLALGVLVGAPWLVGPVAGALGVFALARTLRLVEPGRGTALAALLLYAFAPFPAFLAGSMMNHVTTTAWLLLGAWALARATRDAAPRPRDAVAMGLALGIAATIRPLDGAAFALPAAGWLLVRAVRDRGQVAALLASGVGIAIPLGLLLAVNAAWTGDALRFGYIELWGRSHELGFHEAPWGFAHTPARGVELINLYLLRLQTYFLETPVPSLLFATAALALVRRPGRFDRWVLAGSGLLLLSYFAYWHDGFYLGPRFLLPLAPWLAWWTARLPAVLRERAAPPLVERTVVLVGLAALAIGAVQLVPIRATQYRNGMLTMREDAGAAAVSQGISGALILARETWGAQLVARMWGIGVSRTEAEQVYRTTDACALDGALAVVEAEGGGADALRERLAPLRADSARLVAQEFSPDTTLRATPGAAWGTRCVRRLLEDKAGTTLYAPLLLAEGGGNVFVRDLHARDTLLPDSLRQRDWWLLTKAPVPGSPLRFERVDPDSAREDWSIGDR